MKSGKLAYLLSKLKAYFIWARDYIISVILGLATFIFLATMTPKILIIFGAIITWVAISFAWLWIIEYKIILPIKRKKEEKRRWMK